MLRNLFTGVLALLGLGAASPGMSGGLNYDKMIALDAEDLAEGGIGASYEMVGHALADLRIALRPIHEEMDNNSGSYSVRFEDQTYSITGPHIDTAQSWGTASFTIFNIVNQQLRGSPYRLYAISGGNDLAGIILTPEEALDARNALPNKRDWPYLPTKDGPDFGQQF